jgi:hypothetical protein
MKRQRPPKIAWLLNVAEKSEAYAATLKREKTRILNEATLALYGDNRTIFKDHDESRQ